VRASPLATWKTSVPARDVENERPRSRRGKRASPLATWKTSGDARTDQIQIYNSDAIGNDISGYLLFVTHFGLTMPNAQFPMPNAQFPMPNSQCPIPNSQFLMLFPQNSINHSLFFFSPQLNSSYFLTFVAIPNVSKSPPRHQ
jgi:hypothetical protein